VRWVPVYTEDREGNRTRNDYAIRSDCGAYRVARVHVAGDVWFEPYFRRAMLGEPTHDAEEAKRRCDEHAEREAELAARIGAALKGGAE
jgi:hypothetical protein